MYILVTGGASFIGSHLVERLVSMGHTVRVADNFSTGKRENLKNVIGKVEIIQIDLMKYENAELVTQDVDLVYHLAAVHGGREFIAFREPETADNFIINLNVLKACIRNHVKKIIFTSSACAYPEEFQRQNHYIPLKEDMVNLKGLVQADLLYGWSKLIFEMILKVYHDAYGIDVSIARFFTAYGPRELNTHAVIALLERAVRKEDPYTVWGDGTQGRDFIFVDDLVDGLIGLQKVGDCTTINFGYGRIITIEETMREIFKVTGFMPKTVYYDTTKPTGPHSRVADISRAYELLGWKPQVTLHEGLIKTLKWMNEQ